MSTGLKIHLMLNHWCPANAAQPRIGIQKVESTQRKTKWVYLSGSGQTKYQRIIAGSYDTTIID